MFVWITDPLFQGRVLERTNIAARIHAECRPGSVLLSKTSWHLVSDTVRCEPRGEADVKGVHFPIAMYEPRLG